MGPGTIGTRVAALAGLAAVSIVLALAAPAGASSGTFDRTWGWNVDGSGVFGICTDAPNCLAGVAGGLGGQMNLPQGVAIGAAGNIYVADSGNNRILQFDDSGNFISAWGVDVDATNPGTNYELCAPPDTCQAGQANGQAGGMNTPQGIATDAAGNVYLADTIQNRIEVFNSLGDIQLVFGDNVNVNNPGGGYEICGPVTSTDCQAGAVGGLGGEMNGPVGVAIDPAGNIYVGDNGNNRIQRFDQNANWQRTWGMGVNATTPGGGFEICTAASGATCQTGSQGGQGGEMDFPAGVATDATGHVYVADAGNERVQRFDSLGNWEIVAGKDVNQALPTNGFEVCTAESGDICQSGITGTGLGEMSSPEGVATDGAGSLYVADTGNARIQRFDSADIVTWGSFGSAGGEMSTPFAVASDAAGTVYLADESNNRIQKFAADLPPGPQPPEEPLVVPPAGITPLTPAPTAPSTGTKKKRSCKKKATPRKRKQCRQKRRQRR